MIAATALLSACPGDEGLPTALGDCPDDSVVVWADVEPIFSANCTRCHDSELGPGERNGAPEAVNFDNSSDAALNGFRTWTMIQMGLMPLNAAPLPEEDALLIWEWLSCGGPE